MPAIDPSALGPFALDPFALDPSALDPSALDPSALDPSALDPSALDTPRDDPPRRDGPRIVSRAQPCFGTLVIVSIHDDGQDPACGQDAIARAFDACHAVHRALSAHDPDSDLGRIARAAAGDELTVSTHTTAVLALARHWHRESGGRFDPAVGRRLAADGLRPGLQPAATGRLADVIALAPDRVRVRHPVSLDLGGLAKGYGVDRAIDALRAAGIECALVNAGGDLRVVGARRWPLALRASGSPTRVRRVGPAADGPGRAIATREGFALASSGTWLREPGQPHSALVDPRRGRRLRAQAHGCTVLAPDAATADALTKLVLLTPRLPRRVLARARARAWAH